MSKMPESSKMNINNKCAGGAFTTPEGNVIFQLRDDKPGINSPGMVHVFGGGLEAGETDWQAFLREMEEETGLPRIRLSTARYLCKLEEEVEGSSERNEVYLCVVPDVLPEEIVVAEGQGIVVIKPEQPTDPRFTPLAREVLRRVITEREEL